MAKNYVEVKGQRYKLWGAAMEAFRAQLDITGYGDPVDGEPAWRTEARTRAVARRRRFLVAMPPRVRWWLIQAALQLAQEAALVQEVGVKAIEQEGDQ